MFQNTTKWAFTVNGFAGRMVYTGHGSDLRNDNVSDRYGELLLLTDKEEFVITGQAVSWGDVSFMFKDGPCFIGNNPVMGVPSVEMRYGDKTDHREIDKGVDSIFKQDGVKYTFHRPDPDDPDYKLFYVTIEHDEAAK